MLIIKKPLDMAPLRLQIMLICLPNIDLIDKSGKELVISDTFKSLALPKTKKTDFGFATIEMVEIRPVEKMREATSGDELL